MYLRHNLLHTETGWIDSFETSYKAHLAIMQNVNRSNAVDTIEYVVVAYSSQLSLRVLHSLMLYNNSSVEAHWPCAIGMGD